MIEQIPMIQMMGNTDVHFLSRLSCIQTQTNIDSIVFKINFKQLGIFMKTISENYT